jgi:hypothetical protein
MTEFQAPPGADAPALHDTVAAALRKAFNLGQTYWQQADSESYSQNAKSDITRGKFDALLDETTATVLAAAPSPVPAHDPADTVQLVGVKDGVETVIGTATMSPRMKAQDLVREMFGAWEHDDGSDADMAFAVCEQLIKWMPLNPPVFNVQAPAVRDEEPADSAVRQDAERWRALQLMWKADVIAGMDENGRALRTRHAGPWGLTERVDAKRATLAAQPPVQGRES